MMCEKICLSDFITLQRGFDLPATLRRSGTVPVVASTGVSSWHNVAKVKAPGVVIGRSGSIGGGQYIEKDFWPLNTTLYVKDFKGNNPKYVFYALRSIDFSAFNAGAGVPTLNRNHIASLEVDYKPRDIQDLIVSRLEPFDSAIANCRNQIALLEEAAMRLYREWFADGKGEKKDKVLGDLLKQCHAPTSKKTRDKFSIYLPIDQLPRQSLIATSYRPVEEAESSLISFQKGDIVFGAMRPYFHKVVIASADGLTRSTCFVLNVKDKQCYEYALMLLFDVETIKYATSISVGATMPYVRWEDFSKMPIFMPNRDRIKAFGEKVSPMINAMHMLGFQIRSLTEARDRLLPKLMKGEIEV